MRALVALLIVLVQLGQVLAQSSMPAPWHPPDPGARCPGWLPCPDLDPWAITLRLDPWMSPSTATRGAAGGLRAGLSLDVARRYELGITGALVAWDQLPAGLPRAVGVQILSAHGRVLLWPFSAPAGRFTLIGSYEHTWAGDVGLGLLQPRGTIGHATLSGHYPLWDSQISLGAVAGSTFDPATGAALAELGARAAFLPPDPDHRVVFFLELGAQVPVRGAAGSAGGWGAAGLDVISRDWGLQVGGGILFSRGAEDSQPGMMFTLRVAEHFGAGYTLPRWGTTPAEAEARQVLAQRALQQQLAPTALHHLPREVLAQYLQQQRAEGLPPSAGYPPGDWYPPGQALPGPPGMHTPLGPYLQPPRPPRTHWGNPFRPPARPPSRPYATRVGPQRAGPRGSAAAEAEPAKPDPQEELTRAVNGQRPQVADPLRGGQEVPSAIPSIGPPRGARDEAVHVPPPRPPPGSEAERLCPPEERPGSSVAGSSYTNLPPPRTIAPGKEATRMQKREIREANRQANGGNLRSDEDGEPLVEPQPHRKGVRPPDNEAHVDHVQSRANDGDNGYGNLRLISRKRNLQKGRKNE